MGICKTLFLLILSHKKKKILKYQFTLLLFLNIINISVLGKVKVNIYIIVSKKVSMI
jgi:hypothetical protein